MSCCAAQHGEARRALSKKRAKTCALFGALAVRDDDASVSPAMAQHSSTSAPPRATDPPPANPCFFLEDCSVKKLFLWHPHSPASFIFAQGAEHSALWPPPSLVRALPTAFSVLAKNSKPSRNPSPEARPVPHSSWHSPASVSRDVPVLIPGKGSLWRQPLPSAPLGPPYSRLQIRASRSSPHAQPSSGRRAGEGGHFTRKHRKQSSEFQVVAMN